MHRKCLARMLPSVVAAAPGETEYRMGNPRPFDVLLSALGRELPSRSCSLSSQNSEHSYTFQSVRNCPYGRPLGPESAAEQRGQPHTAGTSGPLHLQEHRQGPRVGWPRSSPVQLTGGGTGSWKQAL